VARSLKSKRTYTAGLLVSDVGNPFYPKVIYGVEDVALAHGYDVFLCNTNYDQKRGMTFVRSLVDKQVDGVLIMSSSMSDEWVRELVEQQIPVVILDWNVQPLAGVVGALDVNYEPGIRAAVDHLVELGHRRFAHISGPMTLPTSGMRQDAFLNALAAHNIDPQQTIIIEGDLRIDGGRKALLQLLNAPQRPTAVFTANDLMAMGVVRAARAHNLRVPEDLSVVGLDDIWLVADMEPPLTTVALPGYEIGKTAMQMLFDLLQDFDTFPSGTVYAKQVETSLIVRQSTAPSLSK
jgi:LacI family transcriptional regulator